MAKKYSDAGKHSPNADLFSMVILVKGLQGELGGFMPRFFMNKISERCMCCHGIPRNPFRAPCGHNVCHSCLHVYVLTSHDPSCFNCQSPIRKEECFPDIPLSKHLDMCQIRCPFVQDCDWVGSVEQLKIHFGNCGGVNGRFRSWMQSIQISLSNLEARSSSLENRVDDLEKTIRGHQEICQQRYIEQDGRSKFLTQQLKYLREQCQVQPRDAEKDIQVENEILRSNFFLEVLTALAFDKQDEEVDPEPAVFIPPEVTDPDTWSCQHCSYLNSKEVRVCQMCHRTHDVPADQPGIRVCDICKTANNPRDVVCQNCQYPF